MFVKLKDKSIVGIVAEYNPLHSGHAYHIAQTKQRLDNAPVVAVMSGAVTQRGEPAIVDKHSRARAALSAGVDLVLELPSPYACAAAEVFGARAVALLAATGVVTHLSFGGSGSLDALRRLAALDAPELLKEKLATGVSYAAAWQAVADELLPDDAPLLRDANNTLALCYLRALPKGIQPLAVERVGVAHDGGSAHGYASASHIRRLWRRGQTEPFSTTDMAALYADEKQAGRAPVDLRRNERGLLTLLRTLSPDDWRALPDVSEGLENVLTRAAGEATSLTQLLQLAKSKRYTQARLRRIVLCGYLGLTQAMQDAPPSYLRVLAANDTGHALLKTMKTTASLPILTKPADHKALLAVEAQVTDLLSLCLRVPTATGGEWRVPYHA